MVVWARPMNSSSFQLCRWRGSSELTPESRRRFHNIPNRLFAEILQTLRHDRSRRAIAVTEARSHFVVRAPADAGNARLSRGFERGRPG